MLSLLPRRNHWALVSLTEHDAEQAVRAGLAPLDAVGELKASSGVTFRVHAGIATGLVVVGEQSGTGNRQRRIAIGEAPNLATQLQDRRQQARS
jgi:class 3 adenylate cyclase